MQTFGPTSQVIFGCAVGAMLLVGNAHAITLKPAIYTDAPRTSVVLGTRGVFGSEAIQMARLPLFNVAKPVFTGWHATSDCNKEPGQECQTDRLHETWQSLLNTADQLSTTAQIPFINNRVNALIAYRDDMTGSGIVDQWATPEEIMSRQTGDCEDFALLKMWLLERLGFSSHKMHVVVVSGLAMNQHHAVLVVQQDGQNLILDNRHPTVRRDTDFNSYQAMASINRHGSWIHAMRRKKG